MLACWQNQIYFSKNGLRLHNIHQSNHYRQPMTTINNMWQQTRWVRASTLRSTAKALVRYPEIGNNFLYNKNNQKCEKKQKRDHESVHFVFSCTQDLFFCNDRSSIVQDEKLLFLYLSSSCAVFQLRSQQDALPLGGDTRTTMKTPWIGFRFWTTTATSTVIANITCVYRNVN